MSRGIGYIRDGIGESGNASMALVKKTGSKPNLKPVETELPPSPSMFRVEGVRRVVGAKMVERRVKVARRTATSTKSKLIKVLGDDRPSEHDRVCPVALVGGGEDE